MLEDKQYLELSSSTYLEHHYGAQFTILNSIRLNSILARFGQKETKQPELNHLINNLYEGLFEQAMNLYAPRSVQEVSTRMADSHQEANFKSELIDPKAKLVVVDLARAGTYPSHLCYEQGHALFENENIRQDHFYINRATDENGVVNGTTVSGSKIGGDIDQSLVLFPDPMGATGSSIERVYKHYLEEVDGVPLNLVALHLVITPEYIAHIKKTCPKLRVIALRLDRGLSTPEILQTTPGEKIDQEKGLNKYQYIVPGLGGVGEILNNSYC